MKKILLISTLSLSWMLSTAQTTFEKSFGGTNNDSATCVKQTSDGGYIICGSTNSFGAGGYDVYIIKTNAAGAKLWTRTFGGNGADYANSIKQTTDGGYIITGSSTSFDGGDQKIYLIKTDSNGNLLWSETLGDTGPNNGNDVIQTADGGYAITGYSSITGKKSVYFIKTAADGAGILETILAFDGEGSSLIQTSEGEYIINGTLSGPDSLTSDVLIKADQYGNNIWSTKYAGSNSYKATSLFQSSDGGYIIGGSTAIDALNMSYIVKTDSLGRQLWTKLYSGGEGMSIQKTSDNGYIIAGSYNSDSTNMAVYITKADSIGNTLWTKLLGSGKKNIPIAAYQTSDSGYIIAGSYIDINENDLNIYLLKTDQNGSTSCSNNSISQSDSAIISSEAPYISPFPEPLYFVPGENLAVPYVNNAATAVSDPNTIINTVCITSQPLIFTQPIVNDLISKNNETIETGESSFVTKEGIEANENKNTESNDQRRKDMEAAKDTDQKMISQTFNVFPNPSNGIDINVAMNAEKTKEVLVVVYDELGRESYSKVLFTGDNAENTFAIDPSGKLKPGVYMVTATSEKNKYFKRLIVK